MSDSPVFSTAKNGSTTCSVHGICLHSSYNPEREAERFVAAVECAFNPLCVLITEPALSYTAAFLRKRFSSAKICAVRYSHAFQKTDSLWDHVFYTDESSDSLENDIFNIFGEEVIAATLFISWQPGAQAFEKQHKTAWSAIKQAVLKSQTVLSTRTYFARRWLKNACLFCLSVRQTCMLSRGSMPVLVAASGPSLAFSIPFIRKYRQDVFLIAVSSAVEPLLYAGITPDLCISTDGGFYAKKHLETLIRSGKDIPLALTAESAVIPGLNAAVPVLALTYGDMPEKEFLSCCGIQAMSAERNGTVSGTAVRFALSVTTGTVYCCGLDLASAKGYQHTQPNALERDSGIFDTRLRPLCHRLTASGQPSLSMNIYRQWFASQPESFYSRVSRISYGHPYTRQIGLINDISWADFIPVPDAVKPKFISTAPSVPPASRKSALFAMIQKMSSTGKWLENAFPADYILFKRSISPSSSLEMKNILEEKNSVLLKTLFTMLEKHE